MSESGLFGEMEPALPPTRQARGKARTWQPKAEAQTAIPVRREGMCATCGERSVRAASPVPAYGRCVVCVEAGRRVAARGGGVVGDKEMRDVLAAMEVGG